MRATNENIVGAMKGKTTCKSIFESINMHIQQLVDMRTSVPAKEESRCHHSGSGCSSRLRSSLHGWLKMSLMMVN